MYLGCKSACNGGYKALRERDGNRHGGGSKSEKSLAWRERDKGVGSKFRSKKVPVTRDGIYERPLRGKRCGLAVLDPVCITFLREIIGDFDCF